MSKLSPGRSHKKWNFGGETSRTWWPGASMGARGTPEWFQDCSGPHFRQFWLSKTMQQMTFNASNIKRTWYKRNVFVKAIGSVCKNTRTRKTHSDVTLCNSVDAEVFLWSMSNGKNSYNGGQSLHHHNDFQPFPHRVAHGHTSIHTNTSRERRCLISLSKFRITGAAVLRLACSI